MAWGQDGASLQSSVTRTVTESFVGGHQYALVGYTLAQTLEPGHRVSSDEFEVGGFVWRLDVYPGGYSERHKEQIGVCLELLGPPGIASPSARYEIALVDQSGRGEHLVANCSRDQPPLTVKRGRLARHASFVPRKELSQRPELAQSDTLLFLVTVEVVHSWTDVPLMPHHVGAALGAAGGGGAPLALTVTTSASYPLNARPAAQPAAHPQYVQYSGVVLPTQLFTYRQPAHQPAPPAPLPAQRPPPAPPPPEEKAPPPRPDRLATYGGMAYYPSGYFADLTEGIRQSQTAELASRLQGPPRQEPPAQPLPLYAMQHDAGLFADPSFGYSPRDAGYAGVRFDPWSAWQQRQQQQQQQQAPPAAAPMPPRDARGYFYPPAGPAAASWAAGAPPDGYAVLGGLPPRGGGGGGGGGTAAGAAAAAAAAGLYSFGGDMYAPHPLAQQPGLMPVYRREAAVRPRLLCFAKLVLRPTGNGDSSHLPQRVSPPLTFPLPKEGAVLVGRSKADLMLPYGTVSSQHALIEVINDETYLTDLDSTNGTTLNGRPLKPQVPLRVSASCPRRLSSGEEIQLGDPFLARFVLERVPDAAGSSSGASATAGAGSSSNPLQFLQRFASSATQAAQKQVQAAAAAPPKPAPPAPTPAPTRAAAPPPAAPAAPAAKTRAPKPPTETTAEPSPTVKKKTVERTKKGTVVIVRKRKAAARPSFALPFFGGGGKQQASAPAPPKKTQKAEPPAKAPQPSAASTAASASASASASAPAERVEAEISFSDERMAAEAAVRQVEETLGMAIGEWRTKLDEVAREAAVKGPSFQSQETSVSADSTDSPPLVRDSASSSRGTDTDASGSASTSAPSRATAGYSEIAAPSPKDTDKGDAGGTSRNPEVMPASQSAGTGLRRADPAAAAPSGGGGSFAGALGGVLSGLGNLITASNVQINNNVTNVYNLSLGSGKGAEIAEAKSALLRALLGTDRGAVMTPAARGKVEAAARGLEALNPTKKPLRSPFLNGRWEMQFSTSPTGLGAGSGIPGLRPSGAPYQTIDMFGLLLLNEETYQPLPFIKWTNASAAELVPRTDIRMAVNVKGFKVGGIDMKAPPERTAAKWEQTVVTGGAVEPWIEVTYLDYDLRLSRTHAGQLYVFTRPPVEA